MRGKRSAHPAADYSDRIEFLILMAAGLIPPLLLSWKYGGTWRRNGGLVLLGLAVAIALFFAAYLVSPTEPTDCSDCSELWGRWWEPGLVLFLLSSFVLTWALCVLIGSALRRR